MAWKLREPRQLCFFVPSPANAALIIRNDEVVGSIPTSSTMFSITYGTAKDQSCPNLSQKLKLAGKFASRFPMATPAMTKVPTKTPLELSFDSVAFECGGQITSDLYPYRALRSSGSFPEDADYFFPKDNALAELKRLEKDTFAPINDPRVQKISAGWVKKNSFRRLSRDDGNGTCPSCRKRVNAKPLHFLGNPSVAL